jgi:hypothetical protein
MGTRRLPSFLRRWPSALGLALATVALATVADRETIAITVAVAALCYLGAAALGRPWVAWVGILGGTLVVQASEMVGLTWWAGVSMAAVVLVVIGVVTKVPRTALTAQTAALVGYGGFAVATLFFAPRVGLLLAGVALASHGVWDLIHYRRQQVVSRPLAEFCMLLDVPLGVAAIVLAIID